MRLMSTGITSTLGVRELVRTIASFLILVCLSTYVSASELTMVGITVPNKLKFASWTALESTENLIQTIDNFLVRGFEKEGHSYYTSTQGRELFANQEISYFKPKERTPATWEKLGQNSGAKHLLFLTLSEVSQKNASSSSILNNLGKPASETKITFSIEWFDVERKQISILPNLKSTFMGPYFGTTNPDELSGDPSAKAIMIKTENKKKMECISMAIWNGLKDRFLPIFKPNTSNLSSNTAR
jgi:hypothetical protein